MDPSDLLAHLRPYVLHVDTGGVILAAGGGYMGPLECDREALVGRSVLDFIAPSDRDVLGAHFLGSAVSPDVLLPIPFRTTMNTATGDLLPVEVVATTIVSANGVEGWIVTVVPHNLLSIPIAPYEALVHGRPLAEVLALVADTVTMNVRGGHHSCGYVIAKKYSGILRNVFGGTTQPQLRFQLEEALATTEPKMWDRCDADFAAVALDCFPAPVRSVAEAKGYRSARVARIPTDEGSEGILLAFVEAPESPVHENVRRTFCKAAEIAGIAIEQHRNRRILEDAARLDPLTGAVNRNHLWQLAAKRAPNICVLYVDVDHFKLVNDTHGHRAGDEVLREVARRLLACCRPNDIVARVGGDEFVVLLERTTTDGATAVARRVIAEIGQALPAGVGPTHLSVSVGIAVGHGGVAEAIYSADQAMLAAKRAGRGRHEVAGSRSAAH